MRGRDSPRRTETGRTSPRQGTTRHPHVPHDPGDGWAGPTPIWSDPSWGRIVYRVPRRTVNLKGKGRETLRDQEVKTREKDPERLNRHCLHVSPNHRRQPALCPDVLGGTTTDVSGRYTHTPRGQGCGGRRGVRGSTQVGLCPTASGGVDAKVSVHQSAPGFYNLPFKIFIR